MANNYNAIYCNHTTSTSHWTHWSLDLFGLRNGPARSLSFSNCGSVIRTLQKCRIIFSSQLLKWSDCVRASPMMRSWPIWANLVSVQKPVRMQRARAKSKEAQPPAHDLSGIWRSAWVLNLKCCPALPSLYIIFFKNMHNHILTYNSLYMHLYITQYVMLCLHCIAPFCSWRWWHAAIMVETAEVESDPPVVDGWNAVGFLGGLHLNASEIANAKTKINMPCMNELYWIVLNYTVYPRAICLCACTCGSTYSSIPYSCQCQIRYAIVQNAIAYIVWRHFLTSRLMYAGSTCQVFFWSADQRLIFESNIEECPSSSGNIASTTVKQAAVIKHRVSWRQITIWS